VCEDKLEPTELNAAPTEFARVFIPAVAASAAKAQRRRYSMISCPIVSFQRRFKRLFIELSLMGGQQH
jgi:hypothetical protein